MSYVNNMSYLNDMISVNNMTYVINMRYENNMSYVNNMSYANNKSYVNNMSYVFRLYKLRKLYEHFYESLKNLFFVFKKFGIFCWYIRIENLNYKNENIKIKFSKIMREKQFLKEKNNLLELEKDFMELKDMELKDREVKIKREIEEILF